jgi:RNA methyltransferase, TrmH family
MSRLLTAGLAAVDHDDMTKSSRITSRHNQRVKDAAHLRTGRERQRRKRFLIDGAREISRAMASSVRCIEAFVCDELCTSGEAQSALAPLRDSGAELHDVSREVYAKLAFGERDDGLVIVAETPVRRLTELKLPPRPLVAVLEGVEKPGNVGAVLRSADAAGVDAVIVTDGGSDLYNPNCIRASLGTVFRDNVCTASSAEAKAWLVQQKIAVVAARPDAETLYTAEDLTGSVAIVLGSEAAGLTDSWSGPGTRGVRLPMHGLADSLNVSTTAAVLFYEAVRQRTQPV